MPLERFYRLPDEKRAQILRVATAEFAEKGFEAASLNAILAAAGLSKGSYYYYFVDKEDLYAEAIESSFSRLAEGLVLPPSSELDQANFWESVEQYFKAWLQAAIASPDVVRLFRGVDGARRRSPRFAPLIARTGALLTGMIEKGRELGCVRTDLPVDVLLGIILAIDAVLDDALYAASPAPGADALQRHADLALDTYRRLLEPAGKARTESSTRAHRRRRKS